MSEAEIETIRRECHKLLDGLPSELLGGVLENIQDDLKWYNHPALTVPRTEIPPFILNRIFGPVEERPFTLTEE